jgi:pilus assembly protein CpaE
MTPSSDINRLVVIGDPGETLEQIKSALSSQSEFVLANVLTSPERLAREVRAAEPDLILLDFELGGEPALDIIDDLTGQFPEVAIIAILPEDNSSLAQQTVMAGARAFLFKPFTQINLLSTIRRVRDLEDRHRSSQVSRQTEAALPARPLRTVTVFSPRGGAGTSTIAINLALSLYEEASQRVLLLEGKLFFGHLDVMLNLRPQNTLADLIPHASHLDEGLVQEVVMRHASGINVLLGPSSIQVAQGIHPDDLYNVFLGLQKQYDYIVIDGGNSLNENTVTLMDASDRILLVANPDLASLIDVSRFIQVSRSLAYPSEKTLIVLNREGVQGGVKPKDIENVMRHGLFATVPFDAVNTLRSINQGIPLGFKYPRNPVSRAVRQLARSLITMSSAEGKRGAPGRLVDSSHREVLLASSRLG